MGSRRSKRIYKGLVWPQLLIVIGVFLIANVFFAPQAEARGTVFATTKSQLSPIDVNQKKLDQLSSEFKINEQKLVNKLKTVAQAKAEVAVVKTAKDTVAEQVSAAKEEVVGLQTQLAEKKRLEALRIVPKGRFVADSGGNGYAWGNCTWWVKTKRLDIGNYWGNANSWIASAQSAGFKTGAMAKTGAIGVSFAGWAGHVVYVEEWLGNGQMVISEMNYAGLNSVRTRIANESEFTYIYELP